MLQHTFTQFVENGMMITGGHFTLTYDGSSINAGTVESFRCCAQLYSSEKKKYPKLGIGILINDIGAVCSFSGCQTQRAPTRAAFVLPDAYQAILDELGIQKEELVIFWEKHIRNRAKKQLHSQIVKQNPSIIYREKEGYIYRSNQNSVEIILSRYNDHDKRGTPACPLIMSAYSLEHKRLGYSSSLNFYYIGDDNFMNIANHFVIEKGCYLASCFDPSIGQTKNVYFFKDKTMKNF